MTRASQAIGAKAQIDFHCLDDVCEGVVKFNLAEVCRADFQAVCPKCHRTYELDANLRDKLERMMNLVAAIRQAEDILGDSNVSVTVAGDREVKIPYALLLTRLNTLITLKFGERQVDFHLWIEPSSPETFR
ncbi:hypothetical protein SDC9_108966 [bioreactor metagenome]|uniref:Uncharacterized protein n=1 Tax=bioreactor metagenome TaxID=1076179 RepID=A0A645B9F3_9ZZZZ